MRRALDNQDQKLSAILVGLTVFITFSALLIGYYLPPKQGEIGVVFPPWMAQSDAATAIIQAGGSITGNGRFSNIWIAYAYDAGFADRVRQQGALFVTSARGLCAPISGEVA